MHIILNNSSMIPLYEQLAGQIKSEILNGRLKANALLPSVRALSGELKISALTVKKAYDFLEKEGFVVTVHGKGTYVTETNAELVMEERRRAVEEDFAKAIEKARLADMTEKDIMELMEILLEN